MSTDLHTRIRDEIARRRALAEAVPGSWEAFGTWVGIKVDGCTCAGGWEWVPHEPQCGYEPIVDVKSKDLAAFIAANGPDVELRRLDAAERVLERHSPKEFEREIRYEWDRDICGSCRAGSDAFPDIEWPCVEFEELAASLGIDPAGIDIEEKTT